MKLKLTTYILIGIIVAGAIFFFAAGYFVKRNNLDIVNSYDFQPEVENMTCPAAENILIRYVRSLPENMSVYFSDGIPVNISERTDISSPILTACEAWMNLITVDTVEHEGQSVLAITVDCHGLSSLYRLPEPDERLTLHLSAPEFHITVPAGTLKGVTTDETVRLNLSGMNSDMLKADVANILSLDHCRISRLDIFAASSSEYGELTVKSHASESETVNVYGDAPRISITGEWNIGELNFYLTNDDIDDKSFVAIDPAIIYDRMNWNVLNAPSIPLIIRGGGAKTISASPI